MIKKNFKTNNLKKLERKAIRLKNWSGKNLRIFLKSSFLVKNQLIGSKKQEILSPRASLWERLQGQTPKRLTQPKGTRSPSPLNPGLGTCLKKNSLLNLINLKIGKVYIFKVTALGPKKMGIDEFSYGFPVFLPNTQLGDWVKAKIVKIFNKKNKYAIAQVITKIKIKDSKKFQALDYNVGDILNVTISKLGPKNCGIAEFSNNFLLFIPFPPGMGKGMGTAQIGQTYRVQITRIKNLFGFAKLLKSGESFSFPENSSIFLNKIKTNSVNFDKKQLNNQIKDGSKIQFLLPLKGKHFVKYLVLKINGLILLIKPELGAKPGDVIKIKCIKTINLNRIDKLIFGKIIQVQPISSLNKKLLIKQNIQEMLENGIHLGEKTVKCHARMKKYIWLNKKGQNKTKPLIQKGRHIINLLKTRRCLNKTLIELSKYALKGRTFLFVGTKKAVTRLIPRVSLFSKTSFFVNTRWLGGLLTNWKSILKSIKKIRPILKQKQTLLKTILEKRKSIKNRLMQNAIFFIKKRQLLVQKGRFLLTKLEETSSKTILNTKKDIVNQNNKILHNKVLLLNNKRKEIILKGKTLLEKAKKLSQKNYFVVYKSFRLKEKAFLIENEYKNILNMLILNRKKTRELITLLVISQKISQIQKLVKKQKNRLGIISYNKLKLILNKLETKNDFQQGDISTAGMDEVLTTVNEGKEKFYNWLIPNPPKDVMNKIISILKSQILTDTDKNTITRLSNTKEFSSELKNEKILILSQLLNQFSISLPFIEKSIQNQNLKNQQFQEKLNLLKKTLILIQSKIEFYMNLKNKFTVELNKVQLILKKQRPLVRFLRRKVKKIGALQQFVDFLKTRDLLKTSNTDMLETVEYLMTTLIDPKLKYPIETIYDEKVKNMSKKVAASRKKKWQRLEKYFGGIAKMTKFKKNQISKNVAIIIGQKEQLNAIRECQNLGIKTFQVLDTNCNPLLADHFVPANDDSKNPLEYLLKRFLIHIKLAQKIRFHLKRYKKSKLKAIRNKNNSLSKSLKR